MAVKATSLVTLEQVLLEMGLESDGGLQDMRLEGYIDRASELAEEYCRRKFSRADVSAEAHAGSYGPFLVLDRPPINDASPSTMSIKYLSTGDPIATDNVLIHDADAGVLYNRNGWEFAAMRQGGVVAAPIPRTAEKTWFVDYDGGFVTPVQSATSGGTYAGQTVTLPAPVQMAVIDAVKLWEKTRSSVPNVVEEKIGDASERSTGAVDGGKTDQRSLPPSVMSALKYYRLEV